MKTIKIFISIILFLIIILFLTNPSYTKFQNFSKGIPIKGVYINTKELSNDFIFSIYVKEVAYTWNYNGEDKIGYIERTKYVGFLLNFFEFNKEKDQSQSGKVILK